MSVNRAKQKRCSVLTSEAEEFVALFRRTPKGYFRFDFEMDTIHYQHFVRLIRSSSGTTWTAKEIIVREEGSEEEVIRAVSSYTGKETAEKLLRAIYEAEPSIFYPRARLDDKKAAERHISDSLYGRYTTK